MFSEELDLKVAFAEVMQHFYEQHVRIFLAIGRHPEMAIPETTFRGDVATLSVGANAIHNPSYESDHFRFGIRHNGRTHVCKVPYEAVLGVYGPDVVGAPAVQFVLLTKFKQQIQELDLYAKEPIAYLQRLEAMAANVANGQPPITAVEDASIAAPADIEQQEQSVALEAPQPREFEKVTSIDSFRARRNAKPT